VAELESNKYDVRKSVNHHTIQINQPTRCNSFTSLLLDVYVWLNMFRAPFRPSLGAYSSTSNLWFYRLRVAVVALLVVVWPDHSQTVKSEVAGAAHAPDDGRKGARNMLSHT